MKTIMSENKKQITISGFERYPEAEDFAVHYFSSFDQSLFSSASDCCIFPGFCDVHVHFREPGFSYKETVVSGSAAAAHGGYTDVCTMPNLSPVPDSLPHMQSVLEAAKRSNINIHPYAAITVGQMGETLSDMEALAPYAIAFSDDGRGVQDRGLMLEAMHRAKALGKMIVAHCEDNSLLHGGYIHDGKYAAEHGHRGICSESEWGPIKRDIELVRESGCRYHVCHISCRESVELIRAAKAEGLPVTCETAPHYLLLDEGDLCEDGRFKMNPPLRSADDRAALVEGIVDGTIDMIATDHAPHSADEKSRGLKGSSFGIVGLETAFASLYSGLVRGGVITLDRLVELMATNPRKIFGIPLGDSFTVWDLGEKFTVDPAKFLSMGRATPFEGRELWGCALATVCDQKTIYIKN